jgi:hypothetical protein
MILCNKKYGILYSKIYIIKIRIKFIYNFYSQFKMLNPIFVYFLIYLGKGKANTFIIMGVDMGIDMKENGRIIKSKND